MCFEELMHNAESLGKLWLLLPDSYNLVFFVSTALLFRHIRLEQKNRRVFCLRQLPTSSSPSTVLTEVTQLTASNASQACSNKPLAFMDFFVFSIYPFVSHRFQGIARGMVSNAVVRTEISGQLLNENPFTAHRGWIVHHEFGDCFFILVDFSV